MLYLEVLDSTWDAKGNAEISAASGCVVDALAHKE
jgi:hypothetical protein